VEHEQLGHVRDARKDAIVIGRIAQRDACHAREGRVERELGTEGARAAQRDEARPLERGCELRMVARELGLERALGAGLTEHEHELGRWHGGA